MRTFFLCSFIITICHQLFPEISYFVVIFYIDIYFFKMTVSVRDDLATGASLFSRKHPLSCWLSSMLMCFAGSILANFLLGEPVIAPFKRQDDVLLVAYLLLVFKWKFHDVVLHIYYTLSPSAWRFYAKFLWKLHCIFTVIIIILSLLPVAGTLIICNRRIEYCQFRVIELIG